MREINLQATNTVSFTLNTSELGAPGILMPDGKFHQSMGEVEGADFEALNTARKNGGTILWSTVCLEHTLERIVLNYFMGSFNGPNKRRQMFENEVLRTSLFQFSFKKQLIQKISEEVTGLSGKERSKLQGQLKKIMLWRNAFAHGHLELDSKQGVVLKYYSGGHKSEYLTEEFWAFVESTFEQCYSLLKQLESFTTRTEP